MKYAVYLCQNQLIVFYAFNQYIYKMLTVTTHNNVTSMYLTVRWKILAIDNLN